MAGGAAVLAAPSELAVVLMLEDGVNGGVSSEWGSSRSVRRLAWVLDTDGLR